MSRFASRSNTFLRLVFPRFIRSKTENWKLVSDFLRGTDMFSVGNSTLLSVKNGFEQFQNWIEVTFLARRLSNSKFTCTHRLHVELKRSLNNGLCLIIPSSDPPPSQKTTLETRVPNALIRINEREIDEHLPQKTFYRTKSTMRTIEIHHRVRQLKVRGRSRHKRGVVRVCMTRYTERMP